jgi:hypothetical protein
MSQLTNLHHHQMKRNPMLNQAGIDDYGSCSRRSTRLTDSGEHTVDRIAGLEEGADDRRTSERRRSTDLPDSLCQEHEPPWNDDPFPPKLFAGIAHADGTTRAGCRTPSTPFARLQQRSRTPSPASCRRSRTAGDADARTGRGRRDSLIQKKNGNSNGFGNFSGSCWRSTSFNGICWD